jgi:uncharacterized protein
MVAYTTWGYPGAVLAGIASSLREAFYMLWDTLWALLLGFTLSGAVQAFAPRGALRSRLGDHGPAAVARASVVGALSSSCSYAASAMARSLFARGADFVTSMIFMFASTNLVVELGVVLIVLMGWQFAAAEYVGGVIMIILLALLGGLFLAGRRVTAARAALELDGRDAHGGSDAHGGNDARSAVRTRSGWSDAAAYTVADLRMLRRELVIGFVAAGALAAAVPVAFWNTFFLTGHGIWTSIENAIVGPFIALISFVCSIGNIPLAAALWHGGISFGGVISFIFGDLVALPLLLIYRKFYGTKVALRMLAVFWVVMAGLVPASRPVQVAPEHLGLNYTTILNIVFLVLFGVLYWLYRTRDRLGTEHGYAIDPVCGMQVRKASAPARISTADGGYWFCSDRCRERFAAGPVPASRGSH